MRRSLSDSYIPYIHVYHINIYICKNTLKPLKIERAQRYITQASPMHAAHTPNSFHPSHSTHRLFLPFYHEQKKRKLPNTDNYDDGNSDSDEVALHPLKPIPYLSLFLKKII